jgi:hypothetical protein
MRGRVYLALFLSIILIGIASWTRLGGKSNPQLGLEVIPKTEENVAYYEEIAKNYLQNTSTTPPENLSSTDLIGRQLIADYIALAANGQASEGQLGDLADKYVETIPTLVAVSRLTLTDLQIVANNKANFQNYATKVVQIHREYALELLSVQSGGGLSALFTTGSGEAPKKMYEVYQKTADKLKVVPAPQAVISDHLNLINLYLENATAMKSVSNLNLDPASAFAGLLLMSNNINKEAEILGRIEQIIKANGI